ncbi:MAG: J domain-containing protein [Acidobacteria bacterium]|nr:J domain-containing protein [Acidobacteriota bacterium]
MDHYQEFGLSPSATADEIRQAHKKLARLLHPDQFQDAALRLVAEMQMKRINEIFAVLADRGRRRSYDLSLLAKPAARARYWALAGWAVAALVSLSWLVASLTVSPPARAGARQAAPPVVVAAEKPRPMVVEPPAVPSPPPRPEAKRASPSPAPPLQAVPLAETVASPPAVESPPPIPIAVRGAAETLSWPDPPPPPPAPSVRPQGLAGQWFYLRPALAPTVKELYPPEYIELVLLEEGGRLRGRYQARYRVTDRAISPEVSFQMEGAATGKHAILPWADAAGARGEIELNLVSRDSVEVTWRATHLSRHLGLASGTAVLVRRRDP